MQEAYIVAALRTPGGRRGGALKNWHPVDLAALIIDALVQRTAIDPAIIDDVILGCVGQTGEQSTNVARNAVLASCLPETVPGTSVDRQCGSSQQALHFAAQAVMSGTMDVVIAAGVESMTRVPMGMASSLPEQNGFGYYKSPRIDRRYPGIRFNQFAGAEMIAEKYGFSKDALDAFGFESQRKAAAAVNAGHFEREIVPVEIVRDDGTHAMHQIDEGIRFDASLEAMRTVKLLRENGRLTAATSSQMCDGASGVMVVNERGFESTRRNTAGACSSHDGVGRRPGSDAGNAHRCNASRTAARRHEYQCHRFVRSQRSLRVDSDGVAAAARCRSGAFECARRCDCAGASTRRIGYSIDGNDDSRVAYTSLAIRFANDV